MHYTYTLTNNDMKSLSQHITEGLLNINEALYETKYAVGEKVSFIPSGISMQDYALTDNSPMPGTIEQVNIYSTNQMYIIRDEQGRPHTNIHETDIDYDMSVLFTRTDKSQTIIQKQ